MAEGTPLERVQVVNSGARVQIPPSPLAAFYTLQMAAGMIIYQRCVLNERQHSTEHLDK
mgnify:CR=1 FL=1